MKRRDFLSLTARSAATLTAVPLTAAGDSTRHGGIAPRRITRADDVVVSAESFLEGHPDKLADLIADTVTDTLQAMRPGRFHGGALEAFASSDLIAVGGTVVGPWAPMFTCLDETFWARFEQPIRDLLRATGHDAGEFTIDPDAVEIRLAAFAQCFPVTYGIHGEPGPAEPVLVYGYATDETPEMMPLPTLLAHRIAARISELRRSGAVPWLLPHGRTWVAVAYADGEPVAVDGVEVIAQHTPYADRQMLGEMIVEHVLIPLLGEAALRDGIALNINPTGCCIIDGLVTRCGVSGRTLASDTYGPHCPLPSHGLAGQGTENIQRSGTLMARYLAKHIVAAGLARRCTVHMAYRAAGAEPEAVLVDSHGTGVVPDERIEQGLRAVFPLTPWAIFEHLDLGRPIYRRAATFGYFGREEPEFTWEQLDKVDALRGAV